MVGVVGSSPIAPTKFGRANKRQTSGKQAPGGNAGCFFFCAATFAPRTGALLPGQVPPLVDHSERSEALPHEGDPAWGGLHPSNGLAAVSRSRWRDASMWRPRRRGLDADDEVSSLQRRVPPSPPSAAYRRVRRWPSVRPSGETGSPRHPLPAATWGRPGRRRSQRIAQ